MSILSEAKDPLPWSCVSPSGSNVSRSKVPPQGHVTLLWEPLWPLEPVTIPRCLSCCRDVASANWNPERDKGNFQVLMAVGPAPGLPRKPYSYQDQNVFTKLQSMGSISALSTHYTTASLANDLKERFQIKIRVKISLRSVPIPPKPATLHLLKAKDKVCIFLKCPSS